MSESHFRRAFGHPDTRERLDRTIREALGDNVTLTLIFHDIASIYEADVMYTEVDDDSLQDILDALTGNHYPGRNYAEGDFESGPIAYLERQRAAAESDTPVIREG